MAKSLVKLTDEEYNKRLPRIRIRLRRSARARHRFKNRSFTLNDSIGTQYTRRTRSIRLTTRDAIFRRKLKHDGYNYTNAVIRSTKDNFLQKAQDREEGYIKNQFEDAIDSAVTRYNKQGGTSGRSVHSGI